MFFFGVCCYSVSVVDMCSITMLRDSGCSVSMGDHVFHNLLKNNNFRVRYYSVFMVDHIFHNHLFLFFRASCYSVSLVDHAFHNHVEGQWLQHGSGAP